jgi:hypothetical protein
MAAYTGNSIVDYLKSSGQDSSYAARKKKAAELGITNYAGTAEQNLKMLGILNKPAVQPNTRTAQAAPAKPATPTTDQKLKDTLEQVRREAQAAGADPNNVNMGYVQARSNGTQQQYVDKLLAATPASPVRQAQGIVPASPAALSPVAPVVSSPPSVPAVSPVAPAVSPAAYTPVSSPVAVPQPDIQGMIDKAKQANIDSRIASLDKAKSNALGAYAGAERGINQNAQGARNTNSVTSQQGQLSFAKYLASRGLVNSGTAAQGELSRNVALQGAQSQVESDRGNQLADVSNARARIEEGYGADVAGARSGVESQAMEMAIQEAVRQRDIALQQAKYDKEFNYKLGRDTVIDSRYADETAYGRGRDTIADQRYGTEYQDSRSDIGYERTQDEQETKVKNFVDTINRFYADFQKEINRNKADGDPSNDWQIPQLESARSEKIAALEAAKAEQERTAYERGIEEQKLGNDTRYTNAQIGNMEADNERMAADKIFQTQLDTIGQYSGNYQAEIDRRTAINPNDPMIAYLKAARQQKIMAQDKTAKPTVTEEKYSEEVKLSKVLDSKPTYEARKAWITANKSNIIGSFGKSYFDNLLENLE